MHVCGKFIADYPPVIEASREVTYLTEIKNLHPYMVSNTLSIAACYSINFFGHFGEGN